MKEEELANPFDAFPCDRCVCSTKCVLQGHCTLEARIAALMDPMDKRDLIQLVVDNEKL